MFCPSRDGNKQRLIGTIDLYDLDLNIVLIGHHLYTGRIKVVSDAAVRRKMGSHAYVIIDTQYPTRSIKSIAHYYTMFVNGIGKQLCHKVQLFTSRG